jgi:hypothetical protein
MQTQTAPAPRLQRPPRGGSLEWALIGAAAGCSFGGWIGYLTAEQQPMFESAKGCAAGMAIVGSLGFLLSMR